jgi:tetratricopeptide (TPR) repeat protein
MVELQLHRAAVNTVYADAEGRFSFGNLDPDSYHVVIHDEAYYPVDQLVSLRPESPIANLQIFLRPREEINAADPMVSRPSGGNPSLVDPREYNKRFPKKAIKEYQRGVEADHDGNHDNAVTHYHAALKLAPDYYPAHNNLGSEYLSKSDFAAARNEFEEVIRLNQSDAAAYFNLSNVCMMMGQLDDSQRYLSEGMRREPDSALGHFLLGSLDIRMGKYDQAEAVLRQAIQLSPTMAQARLQLVNLLVQRGKKDDAVTELRTFVTAFPENSFTPKAKQLLQKLESSENSAALPN